MKISMQKFGTMLNSRPGGREAFLAIRPSLPRNGESILTLDFMGVEVLTPSFADEFITNILETYPKKVQFVNTKNITVEKTLEFLSPDWRERDLLP